MKWNWQDENWPGFKYDQSVLKNYEAEFAHRSGIFLGTLKHIKEEEHQGLRVELFSEEAYKTSEIEGEILSRESLQSSIRKNFGLQAEKQKISPVENGIAQVMVDLYQNFSQPISHKTLYQWNSLILYGKADLNTKYRDDEEPMQIVSGAVHDPKVHFEAPPANCLKAEINTFIKWFNSAHLSESMPLTALANAGIAHLYFVTIHPFEDGNGRIARALAEKSLSLSLGQASLIALSIIIEKQRKKYYTALDRSNKDLEITQWLVYFAETILEALQYSQDLIQFLVSKNKFYEKYKSQMNSRQDKVIARILKEGVQGFEGGLSAENYIAITKTSRATATRDLQDLVEKDILINQGQLKNTRYHIKL